MPDRLLVFDPDPSGCRLFREALAPLSDACAVETTLSPASCATQLRSGGWDALLIGLPIPAEDLTALLLAAREGTPPPLVCLAGGTAPSVELRPVCWAEKTPEGLAGLVRELPAHLRARSLRRLAARVDSLPQATADPDPVTSVARVVVDGLGALGLKSLFAIVHPHTGSISVRAHGYPSEQIARAQQLYVEGIPADTWPGLTRALMAAIPAGCVSLYLEDPKGIFEAHPWRDPRHAALAQELLAPQAIYLMPVAGPESEGMHALVVVGERLHLVERESLDSLAGPLKAVVETARSLHRIQRQATALRALQQVSLIVGAARDPEQLLDQVLELLATVAPFDSAGVLIVEGDWVRVRAARGFPRSTPTPVVGYRMPLAGHPVIRRLLKSGESILLANARADPEWVISPLSGHVRSWLGVPIQQRGESIGLFSLDSATPGFFQDSHREITSAFARQVGVALENAALLARERTASHRNRLLQELASLVNSTSDVQEILDHLARHAAEAIGVQRVGVALLSAAGDQLLGTALHDPTGSVDPLSREQWLHTPVPLGALAALGGPQSIDRPRVWKGPELAVLGHRMQQVGASCLLVVPIRRERELLGALLLDEPGQEHAFTPDDLALAGALADHAAVALHNARSFQELHRRSAELSSLMELSIALSQQVTPEAVVNLLFDQVDRLLDVDSAVVARLEGTEHLYCDVLDAGRRLPALTVPLGGPSLSGHVIRTGESLLINDYESEAPRLPVPGLTAGIPTASWLGVPLIARGETIGAVSVQSEAPFKFSADHVRQLRLIANHIAVALDNARLLQTTGQHAEQLRLVNEIGRSAVSVLDIQQLIRGVAPRILEAFDYYAVQILLIEAGRLVPQAVVRAPQAEPIAFERTLPLDQPSIIASVARTGNPRLAPDVTLDPEFLPVAELPGTRSELAVPLLIAGEVVGVLDVQSDQPGRLGEGDLELLQILAAQIAISLANARLFSEVRAHAAQLEARVAARTAEIRSQKERTEAILRSVADAVFVLDLEGSLVLTNPVAQSLLEGPGASDVLSQINRLHAQGGVVSETLELANHSYQALASPVRLGDLAVGTVIALRDITRLRELDRLKSQFVATVSHELRTPLANLKLYLSLLRKGKQDRRDQYLQVLEQETGRLGQMIEDLLDLSRLESRAEVEGRVAVELKALLAELIANHRPSFQAQGLEVHFDADPGVTVSANRNQMIQVFTNLLGNAMHFTPRGGWIRVAVRAAPETEPPMVTIAVQDNGQGISEADLPYIFERFFRGANARTKQIPGSGLGLAIVHDIVERHGGRVEVVSRLGQGSTFTVWLPRMGPE